MPKMQRVARRLSGCFTPDSGSSPFGLTGLRAGKVTVLARRPGVGAEPVEGFASILSPDNRRAMQQTGTTGGTALYAPLGAYERVGRVNTRPIHITARYGAPRASGALS